MRRRSRHRRPPPTPRRRRRSTYASSLSLSPFFSCLVLSCHNVIGRMIRFEKFLPQLCLESCLPHLLCPPRRRGSRRARQPLLFRQLSPPRNIPSPAPQRRPPVPRLSLLRQLQHQRMTRRRMNISFSSSSLPERRIGQGNCSVVTPTQVDCCVISGGRRRPLSPLSRGSAFATC